MGRVCVYVGTCLWTFVFNMTAEHVEMYIL